MKTRITAFDIYIAAAADILNAALNEGTDTEHLIPERYISRFCELVVNSMWRMSIVRLQVLNYLAMLRISR